MKRRSGVASLEWRFVLAALLLALMSPPASSAPLGEILVDLDPGSYSSGSSPDYLGTVGGKVIFSALGEPNAYVWITDGTPEGTRPLEIWPRSEDYGPQLLALGTAGSHLFLLTRYSSSNNGAILAIDDHGVVTSVLESANTWNFYYLGSPSTFRVVGRKLALALSSQLLQQSDLVFIDGDSLELESALSVTTGAIELLGSLGNELAFSRLDYETSTSTLGRSGGTAATTSTFASIPGFLNADEAASAEGAIFFQAQGPSETGTEVWATNLTPLGTVAVTALVDPVARIGRFHVDGNRAFFVVDDATFGQELFVSDGRPGGTKAVTSFGYYAPFGSLDGTIAVSGHRAYFLATDGIGSYRLWLAGDRPETTRSLVDDVQGDSYDHWIGAAGGSVFVATADSLGAISLVVSDGTEAGTHEVPTGCTEPCVLYPRPLTSTASTFYFTAHSATSIQDTLYATRPPFQVATPLFEALKEGPVFDFSVERSSAIVGERVYFAAGQYAFGYSIAEEPWATSGTPGTTGMIRRLAATASSTEASHFRTSAGALAFDVDLSSPNFLMRRSSLGGEVLEVPGTYGTCFSSKGFYALADRFIFQDCQDNFLAFEPSGGPATLLLDGISGSLPESAANSVIVGVLSWNGSGYEAWRVGDPATGATLAQTLSPAEGQGDLVAAGENFVLVRYLDPSAQLFRLGSDLTRYEPISPVFDHFAGYVGSAALGRGFFTGFEIDADARIWTTDGTAAGTRALFPSSGYGRPLEALRSGSDWIVLATTSQDGPAELEVWRTDGTAAGSTALVSLPLEVDAENSRLAALPGRFLFTSPRPNLSADLWAIPAAGGAATALLPAGAAIPRWSQPWSVVAERLFFRACDVAHGCELWVSEGTPETTRLFQDIRPGAASSYPDQFLAVGNELVFTADDGLHGFEPWHVVLDGGATCGEGPGALCLDDGRFLARASWRAPVAHTGDAGELPLTPDTGAFWFFDPDNVELIVKAIDGGGTNGHEWIFYGALSNVEYSLDVTDSRTGEARRYFNPAGRFASSGDILAFPSGVGAAELSPLASSDDQDAIPPQTSATRASFGASGSCGATADRFCILGGRFAVEATWRDFHGNTGTARAGTLTDDTGYFWFFSEANVEIVVKAIDGAAYNGQFWIYFGALSNVEYTIRVTDTVRGTTREYRNPLGTFASFGDIAAFPAP